MICRSVNDQSGSKTDKGVVIVGPGPSYDDFPYPALGKLVDGNVDIFALNVAITELFRFPRTFWVSNDHDRTFQNPEIKRGIVPRLKDYRAWRTITQRQFIPGHNGAGLWEDKDGSVHIQRSWVMPCPKDSEIYWYMSSKQNNLPGTVRNGDSVLELALEVATIWGYSAIVVVGCDMAMRSVSEYYAEPFRWKPCPRKISMAGRLGKTRAGIIDNCARWPKDVLFYSRHWKDSPFVNVTLNEVMEVVGAP